MVITGTFLQRINMSVENNKDKETEKKVEEKKTSFEKYCDENPEAVECRVYDN
jgi:hypothetical protein